MSLIVFGVRRLFDKTFYMRRHNMGAKELRCNDCGCRFEVRESGTSSRSSGEVQKKENKKPEAQPLSCPECRSYNITTA